MFLDKCKNVHCRANSTCIDLVTNGTVCRCNHGFYEDKNANCVLLKSAYAVNPNNCLFFSDCFSLFFRC